ncbi:hypothetical protein J3R83DRAFT_14012 [Lanmaoa asiatica]|nr:hypothetical protein J3R83DRAFT_14012 [Lanmaoa asiatica]
MARITPRTSTFSGLCSEQIGSTTRKVQCGIHLCTRPGKLLQFDRGEDGKVSPRTPGGNILTIKNQLRKQFAHCDPLDSWTSVELKLKAPESLPVLADLARFLVSSVAFLTRIHTISVYLDSQRLLRIRKQVQPPVDIPIPKHLKPTTPLQVLKVESIQRVVQRIAIDAAERAFASSSTSWSYPVVTADTLVERPWRSGKDYPTLSFRNADAILRDKAIRHNLYTATTCVNLHPDSEMKKGVESSMKSLPPSFKCKAIYFNSEQSLIGINNSDSPKAKHLARLFCGPQGIFPENDRHVPQFIGQSTNQTTGIGLHISAHFLPTMEDSCLMLSVAWNKEVLWVGGFLARIIYEEEMRIAAKSKEEHATQLGLFTMARFAFRPTAPHSGVSQILQDSFFSCCYQPKSLFPVVSNVGISCASDLYFRQSNKDLSFLKRYLALHRDVESNIHSQIIRRYKIPLFKFGDIVREFEAGVTQDAMRSFFVWWEDARRNAPSFPSSKAAREKFCKEFAWRGVLCLSRGIKIAFRNIKYFTFFLLPNDLSPPDTIHVDVTMGVPTRDSVECFGWTQLPLLNWLQYACSQARGSGQVSDVGHRISRTLVQFALVEDLSLQQWNQAAKLMKDLECIPTDMGLKLPAESYFNEADVCRSLPVAKEVDFLNIPPTPAAVERGFQHRFVEPQHVRKVLARIRVCRMMDWDNMVERLEIVASEDSNYRLLVYLAIVLMGRLTDRQIGDLKKKKVFYSKNHGRVSTTELLLPYGDTLELELPILALPRHGMASLQNVLGTSCSFAVEPFIESLGIRRHPTLHKIIALAASDRPKVQQSALRYLLSNLETHYNAYKPDDFANVAFIPTKNGSLARLNEVFVSPIWERLGFKQVSEALCRDLSRLGVKDDPSVDAIIEYFKNPERTLPDPDTAAIWFEHLYLHGSISVSRYVLGYGSDCNHKELSIPKLREQLSKIPFVPMKNPCHSSSESSPIQYICPKDCFISSADMKEHHRYIFPFVDFGQNGNSFLDSCCAKKSPDVSDIVRKILQDPQRYLEALGDTDLYLEDLRTIASRLDLISEEDKQAMQRAAMFPAFRNDVASEKLLTAKQVLINDWESRDFGGSVFVAPENDTLEKLYREMGSVFLGTYVRHDIFPSGYKAEHNPPFNSDQVIWRIRCLIKQRDKSGRTDVSFDDQGTTNNLRVRTCESLTLKKIFVPPSGVLEETEPIQTKAGFEFDEIDMSYTLWMVRGSSESVDLRNDIAVALCHVLLKAYGPNDVLFLASLFATGDESLAGYYGIEIKPELPSASDTKGDIVDNTMFRTNYNPLLIVEPMKKVEVEFLRPLFPAKTFGKPEPRSLGIVGKKIITSEDDPNAPDPKGGILCDTDSQSTALEDVKYFTLFALPSDLSPPDTIHIEPTQGLPTRDPVERFGCTQLSLLDWLGYACSQARRIALDEESNQNMGFRISRVLIQFALVDDLSPQQWDQTAELVKNLQCIPTNKGFKPPIDSYFEEADVCGSLPVVRVDPFLDIPVTPVADEGGFRFRSVTPEHIRGVLARIRVCRMTEWEDGLGDNLQHLCAHASDLASYVIREGRDPIACGGFANIYRGLLRSNGESIRVAIKATKTYSAQEGDPIKNQRRVNREIKVWLSLKHNNVLPFLGTTTGFGPFLAIVCPWVENGTLTCYLQKHHDSISVFEILTLLNDVASGIQYLHSRSVVHGDLSGSNVLIGKNGKAHISDFGLSTLLTDLSGSMFATSSRARGTPRWTAPELFNPHVSQDKKDDQSNGGPTLHGDVYSFGCVMLQILTGKVPYHYLTNYQVMGALLSGTTPTRPSCDLVTDRQWTFIQRCWSTVDGPQSRPSSEEILDFTKSEIAESNARFDW